MDANQIYLEKRLKFLPLFSGGSCSRSTLAVMQADLINLGFVFHPDAIAYFSQIDDDEAIEQFGEIIGVLKTMVGAHRRWKPFYVNFPEQVIEASDAELYLNALVHYFSFWLVDMTGDQSLIWLPKYEKEYRKPLDTKDLVQVKVVNVGDVDDFNSLFPTLMSSAVSLSETDKAIVRWFVKNNPSTSLGSLQREIPNKENLAVLIVEALSSAKQGANGFDVQQGVGSLIHTATDALRVAAAMSGGDVSLAAPARFRKFSRPERKLLLSAVDRHGKPANDMMRHQEAWKRLAAHLRPNEYASQFPNAAAAFSAVCGRKFRTDRSEVETYLELSDPVDAASILVGKPGEFARRLDHLIRLSEKDADAIVDSFMGVVDKVSTNVLIQVRNNFLVRNKTSHRLAFPKGSTAKAQKIEKPRNPIRNAVCERVAEGVRAALVDRFRALPPLGKCWIDERLKTQMVPFALRSASKALHTIARGSRISLDDGGTVRFFVWWKQPEGERVDVDLSCAFLDEQYDVKSEVTFYSLRSQNHKGKVTSCHSGDVTSAPKGACEFIDVDVLGVKGTGARYVAMTINNYSGQKFCYLPECFAGWMMRKEPKSGEIFEPRTVQNKIDVTGTHRFSMPLVIDLETREVVWCDLSIKAKQFDCLGDQRKKVKMLTEAMVNIERPNLHDLFSMHVEARGVLVDSAEEAESVFGFDKGVTPYDYDVIASQYLI